MFGIPVRLYSKLLDHRKFVSEEVNVLTYQRLGRLKKNGRISVLLTFDSRRSFVLVVPMCCRVLLWILLAAENCGN